MAVTGNPTVSRLGQIDASGDAKALFLKVFSGEVLTMFETTQIMKGLHRNRTISSGRSAQFPVIGEAQAAYHTPGANILESNNALLSTIKHNEKIIYIDEPLISSVFIAKIDEAMNHYDVRAPYSAEIGRQLAYAYDKNVLQTICLAGRASATISGVTEGGTVIAGGATVETSGIDLAEAIFDAAQALDENDVPAEGRHAVVRPAQYYMLVQETDTINSLWGGKGSYSEGDVLKIAGINIHKSNHLPSTDLSSQVTGTNNTYHGNFSNTICAVWQEQAVGTVTLLDLAMEMEYLIANQGTLMVAKFAKGTGILRPECAVEITKA